MVMVLPRGTMAAKRRIRMARDAAPRFQLVAPEQLHWRHWDDWSLVFQAASGDTHLLNPSAVELLHRLHDTPATAAELARGVGRLQC